MALQWTADSREKLIDMGMNLGTDVHRKHDKWVV
jgi:hypothetical protein